VCGGSNRRSLLGTGKRKEGGVRQIADKKAGADAKTKGIERPICLKSGRRARCKNTKQGFRERCRPSLRTGKGERLPTLRLPLGSWSPSRGHTQTKRGRKKSGTE